MPIVVCDACGAKLRAPESLRGKRVSCSTCKVIISVPKVDDLDVVADPIQTRPSRSRPEPIRRRDDRDDEAEDDRPRRRRGRFSCPYCDEPGPPEERSKIAVAGWIMFVAIPTFCLFFAFCTFGLSLFGLPFTFLAFLIREPYRKCRACRATLN